MQLGVPTYRDHQVTSLWLTTVLTLVVSPILHEIRFAVYPILRSDADNAPRMLESFDWAGVVGVLGKPQFSSLNKVTFVSGRFTDYQKIADAFIPLQPVLQKVIPGLFAPLTKNGVELVFRCV